MKKLNSSTIGNNLSQYNNPVYIGLCVLILLLIYLIIMRIIDIYWSTTAKEGFQAKSKNNKQDNTKQDIRKTDTVNTTA